MLALIIQWEAENGAFTPEMFYTVNLDGDGFTASSEKYKKKPDAGSVASAC